MTTSSSVKLSASLVCANMLNLEAEITRLDAGKIDGIHFDVMDGLFVPRYGLHPEMLQALRTLSPTPVDVHMMVGDPESYIDEFSRAGADYYAVHAEVCPHLHRTVRRIKESGMKAGVALNPATPLSVLEYVLDDIELVVLMAINPGIVAHKLIPGMIDKIRQAAEYIGDRSIEIEIDGGVTPQSAATMVNAGATMLVCGTSSIFRPQEAPVDQMVNRSRTHIAPALDGATAGTRG